MAGPPKPRVIYALKNQLEGGITLIIASMNSLKQDRIAGTVIEQKGRNQKHVVFQAQETATILKEQVIEKIEVKCIEDGKKYLISMQDYNSMIYELMKQELRDSRGGQNDGNEDNENSDNSSDQSDDSQNSQSDESESSLQKNQNHMKNQHDYQNSNNQLYSYENDDSNNDKRRGRPKGSKNKKTLIKEIIENNQIMMELKMAISGKIKRGKGRPKGSKNKPKQLKYQNRDSLKYEEGQAMSFGKRGKGRPKGSKNKIKALNLHIMNEEQNMIIQKRGRGRPKGAKNKANSVASGTLEQQAQQEFVKIQYVHVDIKPYQNKVCCKKCKQRMQKRKIVMGQLQIEEIEDEIKNVTEDFGPQNKLNLIVLAIQLGDWQTLDILLRKIDKTEVYFRPPFEMEKISEKTKYTVRTKKDYLSKTGKEGIYGLLHDNYQRRQFWWKQIGIERIIESLPRDREEGMQILQRLFNYSPKLKGQFFTNLTSFIRKGNYSLAEYLLKQTLHYSNSNKLNYSQQHYSLLIGDFSVINQLKKLYTIKHNQGNNFCSPIHCAAINPNPEFLKKLLSIFTDIIDVQDNQQKKPIHYASVYDNTGNLMTLVENGADLRDLDRKKMTPLMLACEQGITSNVEYILQILRDPYYINLKSQEGYSALHYAVLNNAEDCVQALINDPHTDLLLQTREKQDIFHLLAGTGNMQILQMFLRKEVRPIHSSDRHKRTPAMIALRNHNNDYFYRIIEEGCRIDRNDSSQNTLLHYAAAYGNVEAIAFLKAQKQNCQQKKNKKGIYPIQIAVLKGHIECAKLLQENLESMDFEEDIVYLLLSNIQGSNEHFNCVEYAWSKFVRNPQFEDKVSGNNYLHMVCSLSEEEYIKRRKLYTNLSDQQLKKQFEFITEKLITFLLNKGLDPLSENKKKQTPLKMCIQNYNLIGVKILLPDKIDFQIESSNGYSIMHCLSNIACKGNEQLNFVQKKLKIASVNELRVNLKKVDINGFDFLLYFVKNFVKTAKLNFDKMVEQKLSTSKLDRAEAQKAAIDQFVKYEDKFIKFVTYLTEMGCDINNQVISKRSNVPEVYKKWGIQHFIMGFPSLKLTKFFKSKIRDFNALNNVNRSPLHLLCINFTKGNLFDTQNCALDDYKTQNILEYLLSNGLNPNIEDNFKALPVLYAAQNNQIEFMRMLRKHKSEMNFCSVGNEVPFIEIIKKSSKFKFEEIEALLKLGCDPNFLDMDKRSSLHHLVYYSQSFDASPQICKLLIEHGAKVNALDKFERSPIFYCFTSIQSQEEIKGSSESKQSSKRKSHQEELMNDKVGILQVLMNVKEINLNLLDVYRRSLVHYACEKNYFYSILYLLDKNINIEVKDFEDNTPLAVCLKSKNLDQAALIIKKGVKYGYINQSGQKMSYFGYAIKNLSVGICFMLLDYGYPIQKALEQVPSEVFKQILIKKYIK